MESLVGKHFTKGLADSTHKSYSSAQRRYLDFCRRARFQTLPATETVLCYLVAYLAKKKLKHGTIKAYLLAARFLHISELKPDPFLPWLTRLQYVFRGVKRCQSMESGQLRERLPISLDLLRAIKKVWNSNQAIQNRPMLWAACCIAFFGFLRIGEMVVPNNTAYDPSVHLSLSDISVDNLEGPAVIRLTSQKQICFKKGWTCF